MIRVLVIFSGSIMNDGISNNLMNYLKYLDSNIIYEDFVCLSKKTNKFDELISQKKSKIFELPYRNKNVFKYIKELKRIIKNGNYDIVHVHGSSSTMAIELKTAKSCGVKTRIAHSRNTTCNHKIIDFVLRPFLYHYATNYFACGEMAGKWLFRNRKFTVIKNGNDVDKLKFNLEKREAYRKENGYTDNDIILLNVGMFNAQKNQIYLIDIFSRLHSYNKNYKLILVGTGGNLLQVKTKVDELDLGNYVTFAGNVTNVSNVLSAADIFVFPSLFEGFPNALVEAQISGLKCVVSNKITKDVDLVDDIYFLDLNNMNEWIETILKIDIDNRISYSKTCVDKVMNNGYDIKSNSLTLIKEYQELLNGDL